jgi:NADH dehydrogenase (ubiquinone) flavoprotein 2
MNDNAALQKQLDDILQRYPTKSSALLPLMWACQRQLGWLSPDTMRSLAERTSLSPTTVESIASFYTMFHREPPAQYVIQVCASLSCHLCLSGKLLRHLENKFDISGGESTPDRRFAIAIVQCLGSCDGAPVVRINDQAYTEQTPKSLDRVLDALP